MNLFDLLRRSTSTTDTTLGFGSIDDMIADLPPEIQRIIKGDLGGIVGSVTTGIVISASAGDLPPSILPPDILRIEAEFARSKAAISTREAEIHLARAAECEAVKALREKQAIWQQDHPDSSIDDPEYLAFIDAEYVAAISARDNWEALREQLSEFIDAEHERFHTLVDEIMGSEPTDDAEADTDREPATATA